MSNTVKTPNAVIGESAMKIDFDVERRLFNMTMEHRAEEFEKFLLSVEEHYIEEE